MDEEDWNGAKGGASRGFSRGRKSRAGFKVVHYSIQSNHIHLIVEAENNAALTRGMISLKTRIARRLNAFFGRVGRFFADRYHMVTLRSVKQVRRAIIYVLQNARRHGIPLPKILDDYSSAAWFGEWLETVRVRGAQHIECPVEPYDSMLFHQGANQLGRISVYEQPRRR